MVFICPKCHTEIVHSNLLRVEKMPSNYDDDSLLIRVTYRHRCTPDYLSAAFPAEKESLRRLFPDKDTLVLPWPRIEQVLNGALIDAYTVDKLSLKAEKEKIISRAIWELEQTEGAWDALLFMRNPRYPEEKT